MPDLPPPILTVQGGANWLELETQPIGHEEDGTPIFAQPPAEGNAIPGSCLRVLHGPRVECPHLCPGRQEDGSCLVDIVRLANDNGVEWSFAVTMTERGPLWVYDGPPLD